jgi:hypothetical protein
MTDIFESGSDNDDEKIIPKPTADENDEDGVILDTSVSKALKGLDNSKNGPELKKWMRGWIHQQADGSDESDLAIRDKLKEMKDASLGQMMEVMADVYMRKHPDELELPAGMPTTLDLTIKMLSTIKDYAGGDENPVMANIGMVVDELSSELNTRLKAHLNDADDEMIERKEKESLPDYLRRQKDFSVQQAKERHQLKFEECQTAIRDAEKLWTDVEASKAVLTGFLEQKHYDTFYFSPEGSLVTVGEAKDQHLNEDGRAQLEEHIRKAEKEYYRLLDEWREKSREVDKLTQEEYEAEDDIQTTIMIYDRRIQDAEKEGAAKKK